MYDEKQKQPRILHSDIRRMYMLRIWTIKCYASNLEKNIT